MDITSTNSKVKMFSDITPAGLSFEGYSADAGWASEAIQLAEGRMGIDGNLSFGYTPNPVSMTFTFQPDSPTIETLNNIVLATQTARKPTILQMNITIPALNRTYSCVNGSIINAKVIADGAKVLEPQTYTILFKTITPSPL